MRRLFLALTASAAFAVAELSAQQSPAPARSQPAPQEYLFPSGAGLLFFHVRPDKTADFEAVVARLAEVLDRTKDPVRVQQAASWRVFRSMETPRSFWIPACQAW